MTEFTLKQINKKLTFEHIKEGNSVIVDDRYNAGWNDAIDEMKELVPSNRNKLAELIQKEFSIHGGDFYQTADAIIDRFGTQPPAKSPSVANIEDVISKSELWKHEVPRPFLQKDKRHLAQEIKKLWGGIYI